jgi:arylsulfatase A
MKRQINRRQFVKFIAAGGVSGITATMLSGCTQASSEDAKPLARRGAGTLKKPNFVVIFCDDLGYGDPGCYGHPTIRTPNIDQMAAEGQKWTDFYAAASVCTPSRAALMTGRLPIRSGMCSDKRRVLFPNSAAGLPSHEITIAEALKTVGYTTACVGKWHLGHLPQYLPTRNGFDSYLGIPYSNDMDHVAGAPRDLGGAKTEWWNVPLMRDEQVIERPANQHTLTKRYTERAVEFIRQSKDKPFFLYFAHTFPHIPLFASKDFDGKSLRGLYGDVVEELDWSVGRVLQTLKDEALTENTLVVFTSDNGPWLTMGKFGGSAGLLREGKGCTYEGGMREPSIMWWPGRIRPGVISDMGSTMDMLPTILKLAGAAVPTDRVIDGVDLGPALFGTGRSPRNVMFYYRGAKLYAIRKGPYKAHFFTKPAYGRNIKEARHDPPLLFHLGHDPSEKFDVSKNHPEIIEDIRKELERHLANLVPGEDQLAKIIRGN